MVNITQEQLNSCKSIADVCRFLGWVPYGDNYRRAKKLIKEMDCSHFNKGPWNKGKTIKHSSERPLEEILVKNSDYRNTNHLRERLVKEGLKLYKCEIEGCEYCQNLELHHINGDPTDNRIENLQILCPNHHAATENFRGKNSSIATRTHRPANEMIISEEDAEIRRQEKLVKKREYNRAKYKEQHPNAKEGLRKDTKREIIVCPICNKEFPRTAKRKVYCSDECRKQGQTQDGKRPSVFELIKVFKEKETFVAVAKHYNVTDNAIRKWCKLYQIPTHTKELKEFINNL